MLLADEVSRLPVPDHTRADVERLVEQYRRNADVYAKPSYKEAHCRQEFIDPLLEALGWDMRNKAGNAPAYRDVIHEDAVRVSGATKAPDYCFRIAGQPRFYLEAKKPSVRVKDDETPAYQLRRYGWSANLPLSILTDFEELAVYDCRLRPKPGDGASVARIALLTYDQYLDLLPDLYSVFSKEGILKGSFDRYAEDKRGHRGTSAVDAEFLKEIEAWRDLLAREIALRNPALSVHELNFAVQATIDRLLFLRIAEDRRVEGYGRLRKLTDKPGIYPALCKLYREADDRYNAGLFDFSKQGDSLCLGLQITDKPLRDILANLYYPHSPYEFSVISADILGAVYEQFLGKVIRLTAGHRAKVEEKPEVKKAGGVYYTPKYIVDYIVEHTVGEALTEAGTPEKASRLRILDPACGSGSFLLGAYQRLLDWRLAWYLANDPEKLARRKQSPLINMGDGDFRLSTAERKRILQSSIFGVDIDRQAVEVTKLNLLLKCMEGETEQSARQLQLLHDRILPNIDANIKCGNSLIGPDYFDDRLDLVDDEERRRVNPFDWKAEFRDIMAAGGFDCVIGNPPYGRVQVLQEHHAEQVPYLRSRYAASTGSFDIYGLFIEKGLALLGPCGRMGLIVPHKFFPAQFADPLRDLIARRQALREIVHFGYNPVFEDADTYTCLLFLTSQANREFRMVEVLATENLRSELDRIGGQERREDAAARIGVLPAPPAGPAKWDFKVGGTGRLLGRLHAMPVKMGDATDRIFVGLQTSADAIYVLRLAHGAPDATDEAISLHSDSLGHEVTIERGLLKPFLLGRDLRRYEEPQVSRYVLFPYAITTGVARLRTEADLAARFPLGYEYLLANRRALQGRERGRLRGEAWYAYGRPQNLGDFDQPKVLMRELGDRPNLFPDRTGLYYHTTKIYSVLPSEGDIDLDVLCALLNSRLSGFFVANTSEIWGKSFKFKTQFVSPFPLPADRLDAQMCARLRSLVAGIIGLHGRLPEAKTPADRDLLQRQIDHTDEEIDHLVYELYGLTDDEIALVEAGA